MTNHPFLNHFNSKKKSFSLKELSTGKEFTSLELLESSRVLATALASSFKIGRADLVVTYFDNRHESILINLALMHLGAIIVPINPDFRESDIKAITSQFDCRHYLFFPENKMEREPAHCLDEDFFSKAKKELPIEKIFQSIDLPYFQIVYSSGSSGIPKGIPVNFDKLYQNAVAFSKSHGITSDIRMYNILPLAYLGGWYNMFLIPFINEGSIILDSPFGSKNLYSFWQTILDESINSIWLNPMMMSMLTKVGLDEDISTERVSKQIKWGFVGMAPLNSVTHSQFKKSFEIDLLENYGLSETFFLSSIIESTKEAKGSLGEVIEGIEIKIIDGEILVKSPFMFDHYFKNPTQSAESFQDGYFKTGDIGKVDEANRLYILGRKKNIIIRGGINISPKEVEAQILEIPEIQEVVILGFEHEYYGECLGCLIKVKDEKLTLKEVKKKLKNVLSSIKVPDKILLVDEFPINASGKFDLVAIKKMFDE